MGDGKKCFLLTHTQKNIWHMEKFNPGTSLGVIAGTITLQDKVDCNILGKAINKVIENNEGLRLRLIEKNGETKQYVAHYEEYKIDVVDFTNKDIKEYYKWEDEQARSPFSLINSQLFYFAIVKVSDKYTGFYIKTHHMISDAWTMTLIANQVIENYMILRGNHTARIEQTPSYLEYILSEEEFKNSEKFIKSREYWMQKFQSGFQSAKFKIRISNTISTKACRKTFVLPQKLNKKLYEYSKDTGISIFSLYICAVSMYINRITGKESFNFGTFILNRSNKREKRTMGMYANTVPLLIIIDPKDNLKDFANKITSELFGILKNQKYPYNLLKSDLRQKFSTEESLFDIIISYQNAKLMKQNEEMQFKSTRWHFNGNQTHSLTIDINDRENEGSLIVSFDYLEDMFYAKEIEFIHDHIVRLLWHALDNPEKPICRLDMISEVEKKKILCGFNNTPCIYPKEKTLEAVFEEQVRKTPGKIAVTVDTQQLSYEELNDRAEKLAYIIRNKEVKCDDVVGIMMYRSLEMIIAILAIHKAGAAYMPIDPDYPDDRISYMLEDSKAKVLLVCDQVSGRNFNIEVISVNNKDLEQKARVQVEKKHNSRNLAYVIYTSGSTGKPKGVMIEHYSVINRIHWMQKKYNLTENDVILQKTPYTFDVSVWELIWWYFVGAKMAFLEPEGQKYPDRIVEAIEKYKVTIVHFVPSMLSAFLEYLKISETEEKLHTLKRVFASGEALSLSQVKIFNDLLNNKYGVMLSNLYGPTEATVDVSFYDCLPFDNLKCIPIGKPIDNTQLYVLDSYRNILPIGISGELYIAGDGLARGYINNPQLTMEKFVDNPFKPGERMYSTGDLTRWMSQGNIEYLGRIDHQIKIRGFRIEIGEIESRIKDYPNIKDTVVVAKEDTGSGLKHLCAYFVSDDIINVKKLKLFLNTKLPDYMVPGCYMQIPQIPLSANGKIDRKALPVIEHHAEESVMIPAITDEQKILAEAFKKELNIREIGINQNVFEIGADSIIVINVLISIYKHQWDIGIQDFYRYPSIEQLCQKVFNKDSVSDVMTQKADIISEDSIVFPKDKKNRKGKNKKTCSILLTGSTGFLGSHILNDLIHTSDYKVYCVVRKDNVMDAKEKLKRILNYYFGEKLDEYIDNRLVIVKGDITLRKFGLPSGQYEELCREVSAVVHSAALVKHYGDYKEFEKANVIGTKEVVDFAKQSDSALYHISTLSVSGEYLTDIVSDTGLFTERDFDIGQKFEDNVYVKSKFEAEKIVLRASNEGLNTCILRIGNLTARYSDGKKQIDVSSNSFEKHLSIIFELGMAPDNILDLDVEFSPVDECAKCIAILVKNKATTDVLHLINKNYVKLSRIIDTVNLRNEIIKVVDLNSFMEAVKQKQNSSKYLIYLLGEKNFSVLDAFHSNIEINADFSLEFLEKMGFQWSEITDEYIKSFQRMYDNESKLHKIRQY